MQAVLTARIDRLPPAAKQVLQTAAVIGTEVHLSLLQALIALPEEALGQHLHHLHTAEFLYETRPAPDHTYAFKAFEKSSIGGISLVHSGDERQSIPHKHH